MEQFDIAEAERVPPLLPEHLESEELGRWIRRHKVEVIIVHREDQMQKMLPRLGLKVPDDIGFVHLSLPAESEKISGLVFEPQHYGSWAVDLVHWLLDRGETGLQSPVPSIMLSSTRWNPGRTILKSGPKR
jgi:LacI family transcriptional regulator